ncbi:hypothetical protein GCM10009414_24690 [Tatumella terrea]
MLISIRKSRKQREMCPDGRGYFMPTTPGRGASDHGLAVIPAQYPPSETE